MTHKVRAANMSVFVTFGLRKDGSIGDVFIDVAKEGTQMRELMQATAKLISLSLENGIPISKILTVLRDGDKDTIPHAVAKLIAAEMKLQTQEAA